MVRTDILRGEIAKNGYSQSSFATALGITPKTFYLKMEKGVFKTDEVAKMIKLLHIENPMAIFFADCVA